MWKFLPILLSTLACSTSFLVVEPEDELLRSYKQTRARLTPEQEEFLMELLAADDALIAATTSRGVVDDILQALAGIGQGNIAIPDIGQGNIRVNLLGGSNPINIPPPAPIAIPSFLNPTISFGASVQQQQPAPQQVAPQQVVSQQAAPQPAAPQQAAIQPAAVPQQAAAQTPATEPAAQLSNEIRQAMINAAPIQMMDLMAPAVAVTGAPIPGFPIGTAAPQQVAPQQAQGGGNITTIGGDNNHLFSTISNVIRNSGTRNVTGIVDQSLRIATPAPIREFVTGILQVVYCNGIRRLLGRC